MSRPVDVDRMISSFLSELDTLSDSLGVMPDSAAAEHSVKAQVQAPESNGIASEEAESAPNPARESPSAAIPNGVPRRNIDILLMTDNRYNEGASETGGIFPDRERPPGCLRLRFPAARSNATCGAGFMPAALLLIMAAHYNMDSKIRGAAPANPQTVDGPGSALPGALCPPPAPPCGMGHVSHRSYSYISMTLWMPNRVQALS